MLKNLLLLTSCFLGVNGSLRELRGQESVRSEYADRGMVVSDSSHASRIGRDIIARGGNAVDAAVATAFAMAVTWPEAGNIGGGGFMLIRPANGMAPVCIDYRETAPIASRGDMFEIGENRYTRKLVGVPGTVRGLELAHERYGSLPWKDLVLPATRLATDGFSVDSFLADSTNRILDATKDDPLYKELHRVYGKPNGARWAVGDVMKLPDLGRTLVVIAEQGADAFYEGRLADLLLDEMNRSGGLIRRQDLVSYKAVVREPIIGSYRDYKIIGAPPPSSGGIAIVQGLNMVEAVDLPREKFTPKTLHLLAEVSRRFFLDRARHLGDPDFAKIPEHLTSKSYAKQLVSLIDHLKATESASLADDIEIADESDDTTHFSIIDASGMAVSNTYTLEASWGSRIVVPGAGYLLNNEMGDFNWKKGYTDRLGRIGTENNLIKPGKRMLSSQCPLIVTKDDQVILVTGSPGGRTIINTVFNIVLNVLHYEMPVPQAVQSRRFHHQWMPDLLTLENAEGETFDELRSELEAMGHRINDRPSQGSAHTIGYDPASKQMVGVADYRRGGRPAGISSSRLTRWDFGGRAGTSLDRQAATGNSQMSWSNSISGCATDGEDRLTIRRDGSSMPNQTHIRCPAISDTCELSIEFDRLRFAGPDRDEELRFAFIHKQDHMTSIVTDVVILRSDENQILIAGRSLGGDTRITKPIVLSDSPQLNGAITVRLSADLNACNYKIGIRGPTDTVFKTVGTGNMEADQTINGIRMETLNDFSDPGEFVGIESIELSTSP